MAQVKWIKLVTDVFDNRKIKMIELMPDGDTIIVIWFKLLCLAGTINDDGALYITKEIAFNEKTLAGYLNRPVMVVELALKTFQDFGMIEIVDDFIYLPNWEKYQNVEGMEKIRIQNAERAKKYRERRKALQCNDHVTDGNIEIEKEKDIEKEPAKPVKARDGLDYQQIEKWYHEFCPELPTLRTMSESRKRTLKAWGNMDEIKEAFEIAGKSDFLNGKKTDFKAGFDWIIKPANRVKILEGFYNNHKAKDTATDYSEMSEEQKPDWVKKLESEYI